MNNINVSVICKFLFKLYNSAFPVESHRLSKLTGGKLGDIEGIRWKPPVGGAENQ